jgi:prolyl 4-hydroxylase
MLKKNIKLILILILIIIILWCLFYSTDSISINNFTNVSSPDVKIKKHTYDDYEILEIWNILTPEECKQLIEVAKAKGLHESEILAKENNKDTAVNNEFRKSKQAWINDNHHPIIMKIANFSEKITGMPRENQEELQVAKYEPGGKFVEHYDCCIYEDRKYCDKINHYAGERRATLLIYLNDDFKDGETEFVELGLKIKPEPGKGILFWSTDANEKLLTKSKHKGNVVLEGNKWIATKWTHSKKFV